MFKSGSAAPFATMDDSRIAHSLAAAAAAAAAHKLWLHLTSETLETRKAGVSRGGGGVRGYQPKRQHGDESKKREIGTMK